MSRRRRYTPYSGIQYDQHNGRFFSELDYNLHSPIHSYSLENHRPPIPSLHPAIQSVYRQGYTQFQHDLRQLYNIHLHGDDIHTSYTQQQQEVPVIFDQEEETAFIEQETYDDDYYYEEDDPTYIEQETYYDDDDYYEEHDPTYEEYLELEEQMGQVGSRLSEESIMGHLKIRTYEPDICVICQGEYQKDDQIGALQCLHEYHVDCIKQWVKEKNSCPVCKADAASPWKTLQKATSSLKKEKSLEDVLRQQIEKKEYYDDGGTGGKCPGGSGDGFGE